MWIEASGRESLHTSPAVPLRYHQATTVEVVVVARAVFILSEQAYLRKNLQVQTFVFGKFQKFVASHRTITQTKCTAEVLVPTASCPARGKFCITATFGGLFVIGLILTEEEFLSKLVVNVHGLCLTMELLLFWSILLKQVMSIYIGTVHI